MDWALICLSSIVYFDRSIVCVHGSCVKRERCTAIMQIAQFGTVRFLIWKMEQCKRLFKCQTKRTRSNRIELIPAISSNWQQIQAYFLRRKEKTWLSRTEPLFVCRVISLVYFKSDKSTLTMLLKVWSVLENTVSENLTNIHSTNDLVNFSAGDKMFSFDMQHFFSNGHMSDLNQ